MVFSSVIFFCFFLPIMIIVYYALPAKLRNIWLLLGSLFFYAWGEPKYIFIMVASIVGNYAFGMLIHFFAVRDNNFGHGDGSSVLFCPQDQTEEPSPRPKRSVGKKITIVITVLYNLGILFYFKYFNLFMETVNQISHKEVTWLKVALPIGISFYTFQGMSYVIDVYRGDMMPDRNGEPVELVQKNPINLALYISMFPQLIAGPIVRYSDIKDSLKERVTSPAMFASGAERFIIGLAKKAILANSIGEAADKVFSADIQYMGMPVAWLGILFYALQIYFDFSGFSDMAIGLGRIFGFEFLENFNYPYISQSISEYWRRWHISLSNWFKDYLYIPLGGNRKGNVYFNLFIVFLATGFWHGAAWSYLIWGSWHGLFVLLERYFRTRKGGNPFAKFPPILKWLYTTLVVGFGWVLFKTESLPDTVVYIKQMFNLNPSAYTEFSPRYYLDNKMIVLVIIGILASYPIPKMVWDKFNGKAACIIKRVLLIILLLISMLFIVNSTYNPFIYFRF